MNAKKEATVVLVLRRLMIEKGKLSLGQESLPFLVTGTFGKGRTGAVTTDFAPHWVGGLVDWGEERVTAQTPGGRKIEVGNYYVSFVQNILFYFLGRL